MEGEIIERRQTMSEWRDDGGTPIELTLVQTPDGRRWVPIATLCALLGVTYRVQLDALRNNEALMDEGYVRQQLIRTGTGGAGGIQPVWCIDLNAVGYWWGGISTKRVRPSVRRRLLTHQHDLITVAGMLFKGQITVSGGVVRIAPDALDKAATMRDVLDLEAHGRWLEERIGRIEGINREELDAANDEDA